MHARYIVVGAGLSGLASAIRLARFNEDVLLLERHSRVGGLNSYYFRGNQLFETGLHAITNFASEKDKKAPINRLFRQLKLRRDDITFCEQIKSEIVFPEKMSLVFSNKFEDLRSSIKNMLGQSELESFDELVRFLDEFDPFSHNDFISAKSVLRTYISPRLSEMILCPLLFYGSSWEDDIDLSQLVILFRSIFQEGMFRPDKSIKNFLDLLMSKFRDYGGRIKLGTAVNEIVHHDNRGSHVVLDSGETVTFDYLVSTIGLQETEQLLNLDRQREKGKRLGFFESIFKIPAAYTPLFPTDRTILFCNTAETHAFRIPEELVDFSSGVICFPYNFQNKQPADDFTEIRVTHLANSNRWLQLVKDRTSYDKAKQDMLLSSCGFAEQILQANISNRITFKDCFTPHTIQRYTGKIDGAIYGSPEKVKNGYIGFENLFIAGTDQGFLGIIGSMLSGVTIVNQQILSKI